MKGRYKEIHGFVVSVDNTYTLKIYMHQNLRVCSILSMNDFTK